MTDDKLRLGIIGLGAEGGMYANFLAGGMVENSASTPSERSQVMFSAKRAVSLVASTAPRAIGAAV